MRQQAAPRRTNSEREPQTWQELIQRLVDSKHGGVVYQMTERLNKLRPISNATVANWHRGVGTPILEHIALVADTYGLDRYALMDLVLGGAPATTDRGPRPRGRKILAGLLLGLGSLLSVPGAGSATTEWGGADSAHYVNFTRCRRLLAA